MIEHFSYEDGVAICRELYRCIGARGVLRGIVPDAVFVMRSYFDSPDELVHRRGTANADGELVFPPDVRASLPL